MKVVINLVENVAHVLIERKPLRLMEYQILLNMLPTQNDVETVVLLGREKVDGYIDIDLDAEKLVGRTGKATYNEIKAYILEKYGFKVSALYIAQMKDKAGIKERRNYHIGSGKSKVQVCPPEKEAAIMDVFRHFRLI